MHDVREALSRHFGYVDFRAGQEAIIGSVLSGRPTVAILQEFGLKADLSRTTSADWKKQRPNSATRPAYSVLGSEREHPITLPPWQQGVRAHLAALEEVASR